MAGFHLVFAFRCQVAKVVLACDCGLPWRATSCQHGQAPIPLSFPANRLFFRRRSMGRKQRETCALARARMLRASGDWHMPRRECAECRQWCGMLVEWIRSNTQPDATPAEIRAAVSSRTAGGCRMHRRSGFGFAKGRGKPVDWDAFDALNEEIAREFGL